MEREIKFRGKCVRDSKYAGEWVTGGYVSPDADCKKRDEGLIVEYLGGNTTITYHVDPNTVGQYTGLKDKNGVEIYEGDIIYSEFNDGSNTKCLVGWNDDIHCDGLMDEYAYRAKLEGYSYPEFSPELMLNFSKNSKVFEVIGNIFDNPELLEKE